jgi:sugar phosphate isomerase/epimerase
MRLSTCDFTFPKLAWEQSIRLGRDLGAEAIDVSLFQGRSHLDPSVVLASPMDWAVRVASELRAHGVGISDVFGQAAAAADEKALNDPEESVRRGASEFFNRILDFSAASGAPHLTLLPGVHFPQEEYDDSLTRSAEELAWRVDAARKAGVILGVEPHLGSVISTPSLAARLLQMCPGLSLTLDYCHFACQGIPDEEVEPLVEHASHFHARGACQGKLQAAMKENVVDYPRVLRKMNDVGYSGFIALEYVWIEWMRCNEVDNISETVLLRDLLRSADTTNDHARALTSSA